MFTPDAIAMCMADWLFEGTVGGPIKVLDAGSGAGQLTESAREHLTSQHREVDAVFTLVEIDPLLADDARAMLAGTQHRVINGDFLYVATGDIDVGKFTHAIANPPYARLNSTSPAGARLKRAGKYVPNLYAAFLWLITETIEPGGRVVAIVPRSFFNGKLFKNMRQAIFSDFRISRIHTFPDRTSAFARDGVTQETVILVMDRLRPTSAHVVKMSHGHIIHGLNIRQWEAEYSRVLRQDDSDAIIRVPEERWAEADEVSETPLIAYPYIVSTGKVVGYRSASQLRQTATASTVPLIGSRTVISSSHVPDPGSYLEVTQENRSRVVEPGVYVVVNRFSPTERRPRLNVRIVRCIGDDFSNGVAFENHVNVISKVDGEMTMAEAEAMLQKLTHPTVDRQFRQISGSTQVNASDLRAMTEPFLDRKIGEVA